MYTKRPLITIAVLTVLLLGYGCSAKQGAGISPENNITVESEGMADVRESGISAATDRAYSDAQHKAIEKALGRLYSAKTVVEAGRFIEQKVMANVKGYIRTWEKVAGPEVQDFPGTTEKVVWVKIKAEIGLDKLKDDTLALDEIQQRLGRPDIAIVLNDPQARQVISSALKENNFIVKDIGTNIQNPLETAAENDVEIVIDGSVTAESAGSVMKNSSMKSYQSDITLKSINVADGEVISQSSAHAAFPHIEDASGKAGAVKKASETASPKLVEDLLSAWENVLNNGSGLYLKVKGLTISKESDFKRILERYLRGAREIYSKGLKEGTFTYKIMYLGNGRALAKELDSVKGKFNIEVKGYSVNTVEAEVK
ncbi:hypothetical protein ACFLUV_02340 [Elusimicrobiota bacterium]